MKSESQQYLLKLARETLEHHFETGSKTFLEESVLPDQELRDIHGTFVTLRKNGKLRGCIGHIEPKQPCYLDVIDNVLAAAFGDQRFPSVGNAELKNIDIEISVLTKPGRLKYSSVKDLMNKLKPLRDGVVLKSGHSSATYLPQVWQDLPDKQEFLTSLSQKAGLAPDEWRNGKLEVSIYQAEVFGE